MKVPAEFIPSGNIGFNEMSLMALSVIRRDASLPVAIGLTADIERDGRWMARSRLTDGVDKVGY